MNRRRGGGGILEDFPANTGDTVGARDQGQVLAHLLIMSELFPGSFETSGRFDAEGQLMSVVSTSLWAQGLRTTVGQESLSASQKEICA